MHKRFKMSSMGELTFFLGLQVKQKKDGIFISQSKYVHDILNKFGFSDSKPASTPMETHKQITADLEGEDVDVHHYRSMIGSLMYLTASRPDIMFPVCVCVCVCARFQVRPKQSQFQAVKRIFRYLKGQPRLGLWYPHDSPFDLLAYSDSDLGGANLDRKSTSGGCQFLGARLVSWQCKKQTIISTSTTETEYIAAASCCSQVLWIPNQMLDYGMTFLHTPIFIDKNSAISIVNNPVKHSKTKHIEIKYHFIRDCNEKKLIQVVKLHTSNQFADLFTKAFDIASNGYLFWANAAIQSEEGNQVIKTRVCDKPLTITEECIRIHLRLDDASGITSLPKEDLFQTLSNMGYEGPTDVFKFFKNRFSPQWRFFVHTLQHCISRKTTGWSEFSSTLAYALPSSPLMEYYPLENIDRETTGVSPNPKKVLTKELVEHVGSEAHTTDFAQSVEQDSVNIPKTFPTATLGEKSSKGPRCQETKGVEAASARQKTSTKKSKDPSRVVNKPKGGEDRYNYDELMETMGNINLDVIKQGADIEEDAFNKGERQAEGEKQSSVFEGELGTKSESSKVAEKAKEVETTPAVVTTTEVETSPAAKTELSREGIEIAETLVKSKLDTPKATPKAKGVVIKEVGSAQKKKKISVDDAKKKGKEKMVESEQPLKKQKQIELDEEVAKKLQEEMEKEEEIQSAKDRELALDMAKKLNEEYQKSLKSAAATKKVTNKASRQRLPLKTRQR
ncbi:hypothetical protein L6452_43929 [Arctium lappa]|uniref:Uncharacterized protein n=1 Tax=Arctium lappa TaxID=4217 RepID=A0ACB8XI96_ARCLA|nr:hypothetical protein L6452_43929 [Arctium lappa]